MRASQVITDADATICAVQDQYMFNELPDGVQAASAEDMEA
jgi:hypothetical protein